MDTNRDEGIGAASLRGRRQKLRPVPVSVTATIFAGAVLATLLDVPGDPNVRPAVPSGSAATPDLSGGLFAETGRPMAGSAAIWGIGSDDRRPPALPTAIVAGAAQDEPGLDGFADGMKALIKTATQWDAGAGDQASPGPYAWAKPPVTPPLVPLSPWAIVVEPDRPAGADEPEPAIAAAPEAPAPAETVAEASRPPATVYVRRAWASDRLTTAELNRRSLQRHQLARDISSRAAYPSDGPDPGRMKMR